MELKYFKQYHEDFYVPEDDFMNVVVISKEYLFKMAFDDSPLWGVYKSLEISKTDYKKLCKHISNKNRLLTTGLLKKIHENNKNIMECPTSKIKEPNI